MKTYIKILSASLLVTAATQIFASDADDATVPSVVTATPLVAPTSAPAATADDGSTVTAALSGLVISAPAHTTEGTAGDGSLATAPASLLITAAAQPAIDDTHTTASAPHVASTALGSAPTALATPLAATAAAEETDAEFATRVLTKFPGLKPHEYINDHHKALFGKSTLKLTAVRAKLEAGLLALNTTH